MKEKRTPDLVARMKLLLLLLAEASRVTALRPQRGSHRFTPAAPRSIAATTAATAAFRVSSVRAVELPGTLLSDEDAIMGVPSGVVTDTLADLAVYTLLALVVGLTLYSLYVTLDESNKKEGGWVQRDEDFDFPPEEEYTKLKPQDNLAAGNIYDPVTDAWRKKDPEPNAIGATAGSRGAVASAGGEGGGNSNRYERRAKAKEKAKKKGKKGNK